MNVLSLINRAYVVLNTGVENINEQDIIDYVAEHVRINTSIITCARPVMTGGSAQTP
jgi:hypothetical protein